MISKIRVSIHCNPRATWVRVTSPNFLLKSIQMRPYFFLQTKWTDRNMELTLILRGLYRQSSMIQTYLNHSRTWHHKPLAMMQGQCRTPLPRSEPASTLDVFTLQERIGHGPQVARSTQPRSHRGRSLCQLWTRWHSYEEKLLCYEMLWTFDRCVWLYDIWWIHL